MSYPQGKPTAVHVSYEQKLGEQQQCDGCRINQYVNVLYVLRTGALWAGNIDDAVITFEAPNGGAFVGANGAGTLAEDHVVWHYQNFKPSTDVGTVYVFATPWKEMKAAEMAANQPDAGPTEFLRAAQDALQLLGASRPAFASSISPFLAKRFGSATQQWAAKASVLDTADSWKALGDVNILASGAVGGRGVLVCWPGDGAAAYQQAAALGSDSAADDLAYLHVGYLRGYAEGDAEDRLPPCGS